MGTCPRLPAMRAAALELGARGMRWGALGLLFLGCSPASDPPYYGTGGSPGAESGGSSAGGSAQGSGGAKASGGSGGVRATGVSSGVSSGGTSSGGSGESGGASSGAAASGGATTADGGTSSGGDGSGGATGGAAGATTCDGECVLEWPLIGELSREWTIANYVDLDPSGAIRDYKDGIRAYNGHLGVDIAIASFRIMDKGIPIYAVAPGTVTYVHDGEPDRNTIASVDGCTAVANSVYLVHADGREGRYLHFRTNSITVEVGDKIATGQKLGEVGSSGCSHSPHLHLEMYDEPGGPLVDPFLAGLWREPPPYDAPVKVMEVVLSLGPFASVEAVTSAPPSPTRLPSGSTFGLSVITGGATPDVVEQVSFYRGNTLGFSLPSYVFDGSERHYMRWWDVSAAAGNWRAEVSLDGEVVESVEFVAE